MEECCEGVMCRSVVKKSCGEVMSRRVVVTCCREVIVEEKSCGDG